MVCPVCPTCRKNAIRNATPLCAGLSARPDERGQAAGRAIGTGASPIHYPAMPTFYLHVCDGGGFVEDLEGQHHPTLEAARTAAVTGLRDLLSGELRNGTLNMASFIEIEDEHHTLVATVSFEDAVRTSTEIPRPAPTLTIRITD